MNTIELNGLTFEWFIEHDNLMGKPWEEHDGHGIISDWRQLSDKRAGERVLCQDSYHAKFYDIPATLKIAKRDGWGLGDEDKAKLRAKLGRDPTDAEVTAEAVEKDFEHLRGWCNDEWYWCGVVVRLLDVDGRATREVESLWGIESYSPDYHAEVARELAEQLAYRIDDAEELVKRTRIR